jgi:hypothetical protein
VEPGPIIDGLRVIRSGLTGRELVISGAYHRIRVGDAVQPRPADSSIIGARDD